MPRQFASDPLEIEIAKIALVLSCTGSEMQEFWNDMAPLVGLGPNDKPVEDIVERRQLRARLDVLVARDLFGLTKDKMRFLLDPTEMLGEDCGIEISER